MEGNFQSVSRFLAEHCSIKEEFLPEELKLEDVQTLVLPEGKYEGEVIDGLPHGKGTLLLNVSILQVNLNIFRMETNMLVNSNKARSMVRVCIKRLQARQVDSLSLILCR